MLTERTRGIQEFKLCVLHLVLLCRAVANRTDACFIRVIGSELVQKYVGEGARMVRELFQMARSKKACIIFFDEVDAIGGARFDDGAGGDNEVQRTMLEIVNQLVGSWCWVVVVLHGPHGQLHSPFIAPGPRQHGWLCGSIELPL